MARKTVKAPAGFHWMKKGNNTYKLMKHTGKFKSHKGASLSASFDVQKVQKESILNVCQDLKLKVCQHLKLKVLFLEKDLKHKV